MATVEKTLILMNKVGLHARPASLWVQTAARFKAHILVTCGERTADAKRILEVLQLGAAYGAVLTIRAEGEDAEAAVAALANLVHSRFGEAE
jgi:phosphocarrier protein HPr